MLTEEGKCEKSGLLVITLTFFATIVAVWAVAHYPSQRASLSEESEPAESETAENQLTYGIVVYYGYDYRYPELEYFAWPVENGSTINLGELSPGTHRKLLSVTNIGKAPVYIVVDVENLPYGWSLTAPNLGRVAIGPGVRTWIDLNLQIPSNAEAKEYLIDLWIKAIVYEEMETPPPRDPSFSVPSVEVAKVLLKLKLKVV